MRHKKLITVSIILVLLALFTLAACNVTHVVQFNWNCDDVEPVFQDYVSGDTVQFPDSVKREGYWFCGWHTDQQCTQEADKNVVVGTTDLTFYAKWVAKPKALTATISKDAVLGCQLTADDFFVEVTYWDGATKQADSSQFLIDGLSTITEEVGEKRLTVSYTENDCEVQCSINVTVQPVTLTSISATYKGNGLVVGDTVAANDFAVTAFYNNGQQKEISTFVINSYNAEVSGQQTVIISYGGKTAEVVVTVQPKAIEEIYAELDDEVEIFCGDELKNSMFHVWAVYNNGTEQPVTDFEILDYDPTVEHQEVTIKYQNFTTTVEVSLIPKIVESLSATVDETTKIYCGDSLPKTLFTVVAIYNNGAEQPVTDFEISGYDATKVGEQKLTIKYQQKTATVTINVLPWQLVAINATYSGTVLVGEQLDATKLVVTATYHNAVNSVVSNYNVGALDTSMPGIKTLEISYTENGTTKSCQIQITVAQSGVIANSNLSIHFLELGNQYTGDSVYVKAGDTDILIDAGSRKGSAETIGNYVDQYCTDGVLEYVIATHAHQDHIAGFVGTSSAKGIFERYECKNIIEFARSDAKTQIYKDYQTARDAEVEAGANCYTALDCVNNANGAQKIYDLTGDGSITMEVLYHKFYENKSSDENNYSVCVLITQGENHYLFTGDLEKDGEASLVEENPNLPEVVLFKGGHHGSYTASSEVLLSKIKPQYVCVCCCAGTTEYTHEVNNHTFPAQEFIDRIAKYTDKVYVTTLAVVDDNAKLKGYKSMNGNIVFRCTNGQISLDCSNNNTKLKDTEWFKNNRVCPDAWKKSDAE